MVMQKLGEDCLTIIRNKNRRTRTSTIVVKALCSGGNSSAVGQETLGMPAFNNKSTENLALKLNSLSDEKA